MNQPSSSAAEPHDGPPSPTNPPPADDRSLDETSFATRRRLPEDLPEPPVPEGVPRFSYPDPAEPSASADSQPGGVASSASPDPWPGSTASPSASTDSQPGSTAPSASPDPQPGSTAPSVSPPPVPTGPAAARAEPPPLAAPAAPLPRLQPPTRAVERSAVAEQFVTHTPAPAPMRRPEPQPPVGPGAAASPSSFPPPNQPSFPPPSQPPTFPAGPVPATDAAQRPTSQPTTAEPAGTEPPSEPDLVSVGGLGDPPTAPIVSLPPIEEAVAGYRLSKRTGEPVRSPLVIGATLAFGASALVAMATYWRYWWVAIHIENFGTSAKLIELFDPRPGSASSVVLVCVMAVIGVIMTAGPGVAGYNLWHGASWTRIAGLVACGTSLLAFFVIPWSWLALGFAAIGAGLVWLPAVRPYFQAWDEFSNPKPAAIVPPAKVAYGPAPRFA